MRAGNQPGAAQRVTRGPNAVRLAQALPGRAPRAGPTVSLASPAGRPSSCSAKQFSCGSGECLALEKRCDLHPDCQDGSDESSCGTCRAPLRALGPGHVPPAPPSNARGAARTSEQGARPLPSHWLHLQLAPGARLWSCPVPSFPADPAHGSPGGPQAACPPAGAPG
uniref:Uncharacterized protein n=1 Tax=Gopherus evgoodei TaxID=1825980 RepID=A0A8C4YG97_9SAUR